MPFVYEMIRQELHVARNFLVVGEIDFAMEEITPAIMLLGIVHKKERGPMSEEEGMTW